MDRLRGDLIQLVHRGHGVRDFSLGSARVLRRAVPFDGVCMITFDPASALPTGEITENGLPADVMPRMAEIETCEPDFNKFETLARSGRPVASLSEATGGKLDRSLRHRELRRPSGFGDELRVALGPWGGLTLLREAGRPDFTAAEVDAVTAAAPLVADGLRRAVVHGALRPESEGGPAGLILLARDDSLLRANPAADRWLADLRTDGELPAVISAVAARARSGDALARARVQTESGAWLLVHAAALDDQTAVILELAGPAELAPLIAEAYDLTEREREVAQLVASGLATSAIAAELYLSTWTVQDHLKAIFAKVGVASRGELVARLFLEPGPPRLS